jgi:hypothetical protein
MIRTGRTMKIADGPLTGQRVTVLRPSALVDGYWNAEVISSSARIRVHPDQLARR